MFGGCLGRPRFLQGTAVSLGFPGGQLALLLPGKEKPLEVEWTFNRARQEWKAMEKPVSHVGVPGHRMANWRLLGRLVALWADSDPRCGRC